MKFSFITPALKLTGFFMCLSSGIWAADSGQTSLVPNIHGVVRGRYELATEGGYERFQLRNARVSVDGHIAPPIDYFIQTDFSDCGKIKFLDGWGRIALGKHLKIQAGQFRMPFGTDPFKAPANYVFANRSFIGKQVCNVRAVGAKVMYGITMAAGQSLSVEGGAFNPTSIADHNVWVKTLSYAAKAVYGVGNVRMAAGVQTIVPDSVRTNLLGASLTWTADRWTVEGEYMNKHYTHDAHESVHAYNLWADYTMPVRLGVFNRASFQGRVDGMTAHSTAVRDEKGRLRSDHPARNRVTAGATLTYSYRNVHCDIRLDYEKYFYHSGVAVKPADGDKLCAELVVRF